MEIIPECYYYVGIQADTHICNQVCNPMPNEWPNKPDLIIDVTSDVLAGIHTPEWYMGKKLEYGEWVEGPPPPVEEVPLLDQKVAALEVKVADQQAQIDDLLMVVLDLAGIPE